MDCNLWLFNLQNIFMINSFIICVKTFWRWSPRFSRARSEVFKLFSFARPTAWTPNSLFNIINGEDKTKNTAFKQVDQQILWKSQNQQWIDPTVHTSITCEAIVWHFNMAFASVVNKIPTSWPYVYLSTAENWPQQIRTELYTIDKDIDFFNCFDSLLSKKLESLDIVLDHFVIWWYLDWLLSPYTNERFPPIWVMFAPLQSPVVFQK